jgi:AraC-like DNA-binding protein
MGTRWRLREVEEQLTKDLRETTLSFKKLGEKYGVSRQAIFLFCNTKGITRSTTHKKQTPEHSEEKCWICQSLIGISKKSEGNLTYYETLKAQLEFQGIELWPHLTMLRKKGLVSREFGRLRFWTIRKKCIERRIKLAEQLTKAVQEKDELTPSEVQSILGISRTTLHRYCDEGILECRQHPATKWRLIKRRSVEELIRRYGLI